MSKKRAVSSEEKRKFIESSKSRNGSWKKIVFLVFMAASIAFAWVGYNAKSSKKATAVLAENKVEVAGLSSDVLSIPLSEISGEAKFYQAKVGHIPVRFFIMKSADGVVRSALDACDTCAHTLKGYRQEGEEMVCNNCDQRFHSTLINVVRGGCNPVPLKNSVEGDTVKIRVADLQLSARYFDYGK